MVCVTSGWSSRLLSNIWGVVMVCVQFLGPVTILVYCYGRIAWTLTRRIDSNLGKESSTPKLAIKVNNKFLRARNNTIKTVLLVRICLIVCWLNDEVYLLMYFLGYDVDWNGLYYKFCMIMVYVNCTVNPFVYLIKYQNYQRALRKFCGMSKSARGYPETEQSTANSITCKHLWWWETETESPACRPHPNWALAT